MKLSLVYLAIHVCILVSAYSNTQKHGQVKAIREIQERGGESRREPTDVSTARQSKGDERQYSYLENAVSKDKNTKYNTQSIKLGFSLARQQRQAAELRNYGKVRRGRRKKYRRRNKNQERSSYDLSQPKRACKTIFTYTRLSEAVDILGDIVEVLPTIQIDDTTHVQYIQESMCEKENCSCIGIDSDKYESSCETPYSYTYAKTSKKGKVDWRLIKVRAGCICVVKKKEVKNKINILDIIN